MTQIEGMLVAGQLASAIAVHSGQVYVEDVETAEVREDSVLLRYTNPDSPSPPLAEGNLVTLNYRQAGTNWRLKAVVREPQADGLVLVGMRGAPSRGEQRDFIRAQVDVPVYVSRLGSKVVGEARLAQERHHVAFDSADWKMKSLNLSGNGAKLELDQLVRKGDLLDFRLKLVERTRAEVLVLIGSVVRSTASGDGKSTVALRFEEATERQEDQIFDYVSRCYHAQIQARLMGESE